MQTDSARSGQQGPLALSGQIFFRRLQKISPPPLLFVVSPSKSLRNEGRSATGNKPEGRTP
jgi:hypothetical protein